MYRRNCPICNNQIEYTIEKNRDNAEKARSKCQKCRQPKTDKTKICIICSAKFTGQGKSCSKVCSQEVIKKVKKERYGDENYNNRNKARRTTIKKYGVDNVAKAEIIKQKVTDKIRYFSRVSTVGKNNPMFGKHHSAVSKRKIRIKRIEYLQTHNGIAPAYNKKACEYFNRLMKENKTNIQHAENGGEFYIKGLGYWVDGYDKENNIVYEFDERFHSRQKKKDKQRQREIQKLLNCKFIRIKDETKK
jgi:hypothetical protein